MTAYVDASVLLRIALDQSDALPEWRKIAPAVASVLLRTECLRTLDRVRVAGGYQINKLLFNTPQC